MGLTELRAKNSNLDRLCTRIEELPALERIFEALEAVAAIRDDVRETVSDVGAVSRVVRESSSQTKKRKFCESGLGKRPAYDGYCKRK